MIIKTVKTKSPGRPPAPENTAEGRVYIGRIEKDRLEEINKMTPEVRRSWLEVGTRLNGWGIDPAGIVPVSTRDAADMIQDARFLALRQIPPVPQYGFIVLCLPARDPDPE